MAATAPPVAQVARRPTNLPWVIGNDMLEAAAGPAFGLGGIVVVMSAAAALNIGDTVCITAANTVNKSVTATVHQARAGIVVGSVPRSVVGNQTVEVQQRLADVGLAAAATGEPVLVCVMGVCYGVSDAAISVGGRVAPSTTVAGRLRPATDPVVASGATAVTSSAANGAIITGDGFNRIIGIALDAASGAAQTIRVLVALS